MLVCLGLQNSSRGSPDAVPMPDASGQTDDAGADLQEATSPVAAARQQQNGASPASPVERPKRRAMATQSPAQRATPRRRRGASSAAAGGFQNGAAAADGAAGNAAAANATAPTRTAAGVGRIGHDAAGSAAEQQMLQPVPGVAWGVADGNPAADAQDLVLQRLLRHRNAAAHAMPMRPQLQVLHHVFVHKPS